MAAPIVIELVASPQASAELADTLVSSCTDAAGAGGCTLGSELGAQRARARVIVTLDGNIARFRVEAVEGSIGGARELAFRDEDPLPERFRAAGLVVASLVVDLERPPGSPNVGQPGPAVSALPQQAPSAPAPPPPAPPPRGVDPGEAVQVTQVTPPSSGLLTSDRVALSASGLLAWTDERPWWGAELDASAPLTPSRAFVVCSALYEQTVSASSAGISEQRAAFGLGAGLGTALVPRRLELRARLELALQSVRASIVQPGTGLTDSGGRFLVGLGSRVGLAFPLGTAAALVVAGNLAWLGDATTVDVRGKPAATIPPWMYGISLGIEVGAP